MSKSRGLRDSHSRKAAIAAGLVRYKMTIPCRNGHLGERLTSNGGCLECVALVKSKKDRAYYLRHSGKIKERARAWREDNIERSKENDKKKYLAKRDSELIRMRNRYALYRKQDIDRKRRGYKENAEARRQRTRERYKADPSAWRVGSRNRKARLRKAEGRHTVKEIHNLFDLQKGKCANCNVSIIKLYHVDHIIALSRGGSNWIRNIQLLCVDCNLRKRAHDPIDFARMEGRLL